MAIEIRPTDNATPFSTGDFTNPLCFTFNGSMGGAYEKELYLRNTDGANAFNVVVTTTPNPALASAPYQVYIKKSGANQAWIEGHVGFALTVQGGGTESFFIRIQVDPDTEVTNFTDLKIKTTETAI